MLPRRSAVALIHTRLRPCCTNRRRERFKTPKIYFNDVGLRNAVTGHYDTVNQRDEGAVLENFLFSELKKRFIPNESLFFRRTTTGAKVDFVDRHQNRIIPIEVKATALKKASITRSLRSFIDVFKPETAMVVNKSLNCTDRVKGTTVLFVPAYML